MARLTAAVESTRQRSGLDVSGALRHRTRPTIPLELLEPEEVGRRGRLLDVLVAAACALGAAALYLV